MESLFLWGKIIRELGTLGYDESSMHMASYDWRVALRDLETRDRYFSRTLVAIESLVKGNGGEKAVVVCHSMGSNVRSF
jgi:phospholipid:diacylglycerol acyltransferase